MDTLIVFPENEEQLSALKAVMKAMKVSFEQKSESSYPEWVTNGVLESMNEAQAGKLKPYKGIEDMLK